MFENFVSEQLISPIWVCEETGTYASYLRDRRVGRDYSTPIVDPKEACARAECRMTEAKFSPAVQTLKPKVYPRHGSRATPARRHSGW